ncbi:hypothetical protein TanjilG_11813 [Lupinus angustifolius]|uniref:RRM domain-containing protein n=1 Tax=Lupinus angustifolius TaxID=3871 RepID=A0A4P1R6V0_LUPAN|nr:hypothetical protein TanjilG_11813 [Lupinus angustifolius]
MSPRFLKSLDSNSVSFFFTNFPDSHGKVDMWKFFSNWGLVGDLFIPQKCDKRGRRFGFVRFKMVEDWYKLKLQLSNILIGLHKIVVNTPRFQRNGSKSGVNNDPSSVIPGTVKRVAILGRGGFIPFGNASNWKQALLNGAQSIPSSSRDLSEGSLGSFVKLDVGTRAMARGCCHSRFLSRKNQMVEVPRMSDLESLQDRNSCWGVHNLMEVVDDDVVESFVNETNWVGDSVPNHTPNLKGFIDSVPLPGRGGTIASLPVAKSVGVGQKSCVQSVRKSKPKSKGLNVQLEGGSPLGLPWCIPASMEGNNSNLFGKSLFEVGSTSKVNVIDRSKEGVLGCREGVSVSNAAVSHMGKLKPLFDAHRPLRRQILAKKKISSSLRVESIS